VDASETVIMGRYGHGSMFGLGVQYAERNDLIRFWSLVRDDVEMVGQGGDVGVGVHALLRAGQRFQSDLPLTQLRRISGARLTSVSCSERVRTRLCNVFGGPRIPQKVTNGLARHAGPARRLLGGAPRS
jgi:hypothetical protein